MYVCLNRGTAGGSLPFEEFVKLARDAGFPGCDVDMGYANLKGAAALRDLFEGGGRTLKFGGWGVPDWRAEEAKARESLQQLPGMAKAAAGLHIDSAATWIMPSSDRPLMENFRFHVDRLRPVAKILADHGLRFGLEFVAPYHLRRHHKHEFIFTPGAMLELADAVGPNVGLLVDAFHIHASGTSYDHLAQIPKERIVLCHVNDCPKVTIDQIKDGERLLPGDGAIDLKAFFAALRKTGYEGAMSLEVFNAELKAMDPLEAAKKAWGATQRVLASAGVP
jgi:sugar phosphate isomerase/epimerase